MNLVMSGKGQTIKKVNTSVEESFHVPASTNNVAHPPTLLVSLTQQHVHENHQSIATESNISQLTTTVNSHKEKSMKKCPKDKLLLGSQFRVVHSNNGVNYGKCVPDECGSQSNFNMEHEEASDLVMSINGAQSQSTCIERIQDNICTATGGTCTSESTGKNNDRCTESSLDPNSVGLTQCKNVNDNNTFSLLAEHCSSSQDHEKVLEGIDCVVSDSGDNVICHSSIKENNFDTSDLTGLYGDEKLKHSGKRYFDDLETHSLITTGHIDIIEPACSCGEKVCISSTTVYSRQQDINNAALQPEEIPNLHVVQYGTDSSTKNGELISPGALKDILSVCSDYPSSNRQLSDTKHEGITAIDLLEETVFSGRKCDLGKVEQTARLVTGSDNCVGHINTVHVANLQKTPAPKSISQDDTSLNSSINVTHSAFITNTDAFLEENVPQGADIPLERDNKSDKLHTEGVLYKGDEKLRDINNCDKHSIVGIFDNRRNTLEKTNVAVTSESELIGVEIAPITSTAGTNLCNTGTIVTNILTNGPVVSAVPVISVEAGVNIGQTCKVCQKFKRLIGTKVTNSAYCKCLDSVSCVTKEQELVPSALDNICFKINCQGYTSPRDTVSNVGPTECDRLNYGVYSPDKCQTVSGLNSVTLCSGTKCNQLCTCSQSQLPHEGSDIDSTVGNRSIDNIPCIVSEKTNSNSTFCANILQTDCSDCHLDYGDSVKTFGLCSKTPNEIVYKCESFSVKHIQPNTHSGTDLSISIINSGNQSSQDSIIIHENDINSDICKQDVEIGGYNCSDIQSVNVQSAACLSTENSENSLSVTRTNYLTKTPKSAVIKQGILVDSITRDLKCDKLSDYNAVNSSSSASCESYVNISGENKAICLPTLQVSGESEDELYDSMPLLTPVEHMATSPQKETESENGRQLKRTDSNYSSESIPYLIPVLSPAGEISRSRSNSHDSLPPLLSPVDEKSSISAEKGDFSENQDTWCNCTEINPDEEKDSLIKQLTQKVSYCNNVLDTKSYNEENHLATTTCTYHKVTGDISNELVYNSVIKENVDLKEEVTMEAELAQHNGATDTKIKPHTNQKSCRSETNHSGNNTCGDIQDGTHTVQSLYKDEVLSECVEQTNNLGQCQGDKCNNKLALSHSPATCLQKERVAKVRRRKKEPRSEGLLESLLANLPQDGLCDNSGSESINSDPGNSTQKTSTRSLVSALLSTYNNNNIQSSSLVKRAVERFVDGQPCVDSIISNVVNGGHTNAQLGCEQTVDQNSMDSLSSSQAQGSTSVSDSVNSAPLVKNNLKVKALQGRCLKKWTNSEYRVSSSVKSDLPQCKRSGKVCVIPKNRTIKGKGKISCTRGSRSCDSIHHDNLTTACYDRDGFAKTDKLTNVKVSSVSDTNDKMHDSQLSSIPLDKTVVDTDVPGNTHMLNKHNHIGLTRPIYISPGKPTVPCVDTSKIQTPNRPTKNDSNIPFVQNMECPDVQNMPILRSVMNSCPVGQFKTSQDIPHEPHVNATNVTPTETRRSARVLSKQSKNRCSPQTTGITDNNSNFVKTKTFTKGHPVKLDNSNFAESKPGCTVCKQYSKQQQSHIPLEMNLNKLLVHKMMSLTIKLPRLDHSQIYCNKTSCRRKTYSESFCDMDLPCGDNKRRHTISTDKMPSKCKINAYRRKNIHASGSSCQEHNIKVVDKELECKIKLENITLDNVDLSDAVTIATHPKAALREPARGTSVEVGQRKNSSEKWQSDDGETGGRASEAACMSGSIAHQSTTAQNTAAWADNNITPSPAAATAGNRDSNLAKGKPRNIFDNFSLQVKTQEHTLNNCASTAKKQLTSCTEQHPLVVKQTCLEPSSGLNTDTHSQTDGICTSTQKRSSLLDYHPFRNDRRKKPKSPPKTIVQETCREIVSDIHCENSDEHCTNEQAPDKGQEVGNIQTINGVRAESRSSKDCHALTNNEVWSGEDVLTNSSHCCSLERSTSENTITSECEENICRCANHNQKDIHLGHTYSDSQENSELCVGVTEQDNPIVTKHEEITHINNKSSAQSKHYESSIDPTVSELKTENNEKYENNVEYPCTLHLDLKKVSVTRDIDSVQQKELCNNADSVQYLSEGVKTCGNNNNSRQQVEADEKSNAQFRTGQPHKNILPVNLCRIETDKPPAAEEKTQLSNQDKYCESECVIFGDKTEIKSESDSATVLFSTVSKQESSFTQSENEENIANYFEEDVSNIVDALVTRVCELEGGLTPGDCTPDLHRSYTESEHNCTCSILTGAQSSLGSQHTHNESNELKQGDPILRLCHILNKKKDSGQDFEEKSQEASQKIRELYEKAKNLKEIFERKKKPRKRTASEASSRSNSALLSDYVSTGKGSYTVSAKVIGNCAVPELQPIKKKRGRPKGSKNRPKEEREKKLPKKRHHSEANYVIEPSEVDFVKPQLKVVIKKLPGSDSLDYSPDKVNYPSDLDFDHNTDSLPAVPSATIPLHKGEWLNDGGTSTPLLHSPAGIDPEDLTFHFMTGSVDDSNLELFPDLLPVSEMDVSNSISQRESINLSKENACRKVPGESLPSCSTLVDSSLRNQPIPSFQQTFVDSITNNNTTASSNTEKLPSVAVSSPKDLQSPCSTIASVSTESGIESDIPSEHIYTPEGFTEMSIPPSKLTPSKNEKYSEVFHIQQKLHDTIYLNNSVPYGHGGFGNCGTVNPILNHKQFHGSKDSVLMNMLATKGEKGEQNKNTPMLKSILESDPLEIAKQEANSEAVIAASPENMEFPTVIETPTRGRGGRGRGRARGKRGGKRGRPRRTPAVAATNDRTNFVDTQDIQHALYQRSTSLPYPPQHQEHVQRQHPYPGYNRQTSQPPRPPSYVEGGHYNTGWTPCEQPYPESDNGMYPYMNNVPNCEGYPGHFNDNNYIDPNNGYMNPNNNCGHGWEGEYSRNAHPANWRGNHMNTPSPRGFSQRARHTNYQSYRHNLYPTPPPTRFGYPENGFHNRGDMWMPNPNMPQSISNGNPVAGAVPEHAPGSDLTNEGPALQGLQDHDIPPDISQIIPTLQNADPDCDESMLLRELVGTEGDTSTSGESPTKFVKKVNWEMLMPIFQQMVYKEKKEKGGRMEGKARSDVLNNISREEKPQNESIADSPAINHSVPEIAKYTEKHLAQDNAIDYESLSPWTHNNTTKHVPPETAWAGENQSVTSSITGSPAAAMSSTSRSPHSNAQFTAQDCVNIEQQGNLCGMLKSNPEMSVAGSNMTLPTPDLHPQANIGYSQSSTSIPGSELLHQQSKDWVSQSIPNLLPYNPMSGSMGVPPNQNDINMSYNSQQHCNNLDMGSWLATSMGIEQQCNKCNGVFQDETQYNQHIAICNGENSNSLLTL